ncbi:TetR/AcrR family transcriptional regulator [Williamsia deligens]|uniref:TetR/AcrR family transcriptional regulator n=1 Tax=Williamsia deligens TaxID=321325 RepID=A0ABW3G704_9NOCA|nr:TetR/AcrR family transcriptional regulator [Williamsia deligens]MCP2192857.1 transcriptional regulator, TetR family [Williamsia deligens]
MSSATSGHRRGKAVRDGVLTAALNELLSVGVDGVTVASVAEAAGVHVTSIYRRWKTREQLITDAVLSHLDPLSIEVPDTGSVRSDLVALLSALDESMSSPQNWALLRLATMPVEIDRLEEARRRMTAERMDNVAVILERGVERGEIAPGVDHRLALEAMYGPVYARRLLTHEQVDEAYLEGLVDLFLNGIRAR